MSYEEWHKYLVELVRFCERYPLYSDTKIIRHMAVLGLRSIRVGNRIFEVTDNILEIRAKY